MDHIDQIIHKIENYEKALGNKRWTLNNVYQSIIDIFPQLNKTNDSEYNCIRTAIIDVIGLSYEKSSSNRTKVINILQYALECFKK